MRVAVLDDYQGRAHEFADWGSLGADVEFFTRPIPRDSLAETLAGFDVLVLMRERTAFPREVLERLPNLRALITTGMRNASVAGDCLRERGVLYCGTGPELDPGSAAAGGPGPAAGPGVAGGVPSTAEIAWALIFASAKRVVVEDRALRAGHWQTGLPVNLAGRTLGLVGLGRLGSAMVQPARVFGMEVIAWSQNLTAAAAAAAGAELVSRDELLERSDFVSIHLVLGERSRGLLGAAELALMKPTAVLINTSRGPIVDEGALVAALRDGTIGGAGLDVYDTEPLPAGHPLTELENVVLTPHLGYVSEDGLRTMYRQVVEDIAAYAEGRAVRVIE